MHDISNEYLLQIEPEGNTSSYPTDDELTKKMELLLSSARDGTRYRGWHTCSCGEKSGYCDLIIPGYITNSLAAHYLRWHRHDVPLGEQEKLSSIMMLEDNDLQSDQEEVVAAEIDVSQMLDMALTMGCFLIAKLPKKEIDIYFAINDERLKLNGGEGGDTLALVRSSVYLLHDEIEAKDDKDGT